MITLAERRAQEIIVGIGELKISNDPETRIVTYALGSCLGLTVYDPIAKVGGLLHIQLPQSAINPDRARAQPALFVDTGVPLLFKSAYAAGAVKSRLIVKVAGGACAGRSEEEDKFQIGKRNIIALRQLLWKNGVLLEAQEVGGMNAARTMSLEIANGHVTLRERGVTTTL